MLVRALEMFAGEEPAKLVVQGELKRVQEKEATAKEVESLAYHRKNLTKSY